MKRGADVCITVVQPDAKGDLERMGYWLEAEGVAVRVIRPFAGDLVPPAVPDDALVVLGGSMGALDDVEFPYLHDIKALLRVAVATEVPTLGVCLGAQLLAVALGGEVSVGTPGLESGVVSILLTEAAWSDPLLGKLPRQLWMPAMHFDAVTRLPEGAELLGSGEVYRNQIFRIGTAWGVQFHPEISPGRFAEWRSFAPDFLQDRLACESQELECLDERIRGDAWALARRFVDVVRERAPRKLE